MNYRKLKENINKTYQIALSRGWYLKSELKIDSEATEYEVYLLENSIVKPLPIQLRQLLTKMSKSVNLYYQIEEEIPTVFGEIFSGELLYDLSKIDQLNKEFPEWIEGSLDEESNDIESIEITKEIMNNKTAFLEVATGDIIAIDDHTNEVIYFDHEGGSMHGKKLSDDLNSFMTKWSTMGFFGTESWQFEEMYDFNNNSLLPLNNRKVSEWTKWLNKRAS